MPLSRTQTFVAQNNARFKVVVCGRRWGKTTLAVRELCKQAKEPGKEVYYIAPSYRMAKTIVWRKLKNKLSDLRWIKKVNETELSITLKNGSTISLKGADNPDSLRGVSLSYAVLDEFSFTDSSIWYEVIRPALADQQGQALFITTPIGKSNWAYDLFCMEQSNSNWKSFQYTTLEGGFVTEDEINQAKNEMDERTFRQEFLGSFETYGNAVAYQFNRDVHVIDIDDIDKSELHIGMDFNNSPITASVMVKKGMHLYQFDEIYMNDSNTDELAQEILNRYPHSNITVYPDPAGRQRKTSANGRTDFTILQNYGFNVKAPKAHDMVRDRVNATNARLKNVNGDVFYQIHSKCKHTIESLEKLSYKEGTQTVNKDGYDHMFDSLSYLIAYLFPLKRNVDPTPVKAFGHRIG